MQTSHKAFYKTASWNPVLLLIGLDRPKDVAELFNVRHLALSKSLTSSLFFKPYDYERAWTVEKRVKREAFALKLAVYNKNAEMLKLVISGVAPALW